MNNKTIEMLSELRKEIQNIEASALKIKDIAEEVNLPIAYFNNNRILATLNVLKQTVAEPLSIFLLNKDSASEYNNYL